MMSNTIRLNTIDNVVVARADLEPGNEIPGEGLICQNNIPFGHKVAASPIARGEPVRKYGQIIGVATTQISPGEHVHVHNLDLMDFDRDYAFGVEARPTVFFPEEEQAHFQGIIRPDGRVATRNYIGIISTVNCSASVARHIAETFGEQRLGDFPNIDGVVPICHGTGCAIADKGEGFEILQRTLGGYAQHPNFAAVLLIGLGCEVIQAESLTKEIKTNSSIPLHTLNIQDHGGSMATVQRGVDLVKEMLPVTNRVERCPVPANHLILGLECGGSDGYSGITANPALGRAVDLMVQHGGTAILSETPEIYGAEHLLTRRAMSRDVGEKLIGRIQWWKEYTSKRGEELDNNPSPGNKAGGLTTILEKSLGAAAKSGTTNLVDVVGYAHPVTAKGLVFMDTPGYDPVSVTGMVAGGANIVCFTTGRGSVFGCKPAPVIKLATNTTLYDNMLDDMDLNCGSIIDGRTTIDEMGEEIFRMILDIASGQKTKSEQIGIGDNEFVPWQIGAVL
ncbi:MAG: altronate dehydratase [Desulfobacteraceae bacterium]|nr:altronate dehydratase [Desulfobacteraceae bacterium]